MPLEFKRQTLTIPRTVGGIFSGDLTFNFDSRVLNAEVVLTGFVFRFEDNDRPFFDQALQTNVTTTGNTVRVHVYFWLKDKSGSYDDAYSGAVHLAAIVERV